MHTCMSAHRLLQLHVCTDATRTRTQRHSYSCKVWKPEHVVCLIGAVVYAVNSRMRCCIKLHVQYSRLHVPSCCCRHESIQHITATNTSTEQRRACQTNPMLWVCRWTHTRFQTCTQPTSHGSCTFNEDRLLLPAGTRIHDCVLPVAH